jgi:hypothetical protein
MLVTLWSSECGSGTLTFCAAGFTLLEMRGIATGSSLTALSSTGGSEALAFGAVGTAPLHGGKLGMGAVVAGRQFVGAGVHFVAAGRQAELHGFWQRPVVTLQAGDGMGLGVGAGQVFAVVAHVQAAFGIWHVLHTEAAGAFWHVLHSEAAGFWHVLHTEAAGFWHVLHGDVEHEFCRQVGHEHAIPVQEQTAASSHILDLANMRSFLSR